MNRCQPIGLTEGPIPGVYLGLLPASEKINAALCGAFEALRHGPGIRHTHLFNGRYENIYIDQKQIPEASPVIAAALASAKELLGRNDLRLGFWFNRMGPGERTGLHTHADADELLSGVYYVQVPPGGGRLLLHAGGGRHAVEPRTGQFVFFAPSVPHEVEPNTSEQVRLSVAFNIGPAVWARP